MLKAAEPIDNRACHIYYLIKDVMMKKSTHT